MDLDFWTGGSGDGTLALNDRNDGSRWPVWWLILRRNIQAIREVTMDKYRMTQKWLTKLVPNLRVCDMNRIAYQQLLNDYAIFHERQTTMDFHHQLKGAILDAVDDGLIERDPTRKAIIKGKHPASRKMKYLNQFSELLRNHPADKPIFVHSTVYNSTVNDILSKRCKACHIPVISLHGLRHPYVKQKTKKFAIHFGTGRSVFHSLRPYPSEPLHVVLCVASFPKKSRTA